MTLFQSSCQYLKIKQAAYTPPAYHSTGILMYFVDPPLEKYFGHHWQVLVSTTGYTIKLALPATLAQWSQARIGNFATLKHTEPSRTFCFSSGKLTWVGSWPWATSTPLKQRNSTRLLWEKALTQGQILLSLALWNASKHSVQAPTWIYWGTSSKGCQGQLKNWRILLTRIIMTPEIIEAGEEKALGEILSMCKK